MARTTTEAAKAATQINYTATPTLSNFHKSDAYARIALGPVGSGKSIACIMELFMLACNQDPNNDGIRQSRSLVTRSTYPALKSTTIRSFMEWLGPLVDIVYDSPIRAMMRLPLPDGTTVEWETLFYSIDGSPESLQRLRSLEITNAFINEAANTTSETISVIKSRIGRFPAIIKGTPPTRPCLIMDSNFGTKQSPLKKLLSEAPEGHAFFIQPPAVFWDHPTSSWQINPNAENLKFLSQGYYEKMMQGMETAQIQMLLANQWATPNAGKPVYPEFAHNHKFHGVLQHSPNQPVIVGMDFGLHVAAAFGQLSPTGTAAVIAELWHDDMDLDTFIETMLQPFVQQRFPNSPIIVCGDPTGANRSSLDSRTAFSTLRKAGFEVTPSHTNDPEMRIGDVKYFLNRNHGLVVSTECVRAIEGFEGAYGYAQKTQTEEAANIEFKDRPEKNDHSHIHDGIQYLMSYLRHGRYVTKAPKGWEASRRRMANLEAQSRQRTGRTRSAQEVSGIPVAQDPTKWGGAYQQPTRQQPTNPIHRYV